MCGNIFYVGSTELKRVLEGESNVLVFFTHEEIYEEVGVDPDQVPNFTKISFDVEPE